MKQHRVTIHLADDTAEFLESLQAGAAESVSDFINSLLRQERFRQGYPSHADTDISSHPVTSPEEKEMLRRSGLLPFRPRRH